MLEKAKEVLKEYYGYENFRTGQEPVITDLLEGRDTLAVMPTGAGKSLCFQIPALLLPGVTLVVSPLISLMKDQVDGLESQGIPSTFINSSLSGEAVYQRLNALTSGRYKMVYVAPERLETEVFQGVFRQLELSMIAVDEAHCVSQWGHDFRPSYRGISRFIESLPTRPVIGAFTATATPQVKEDIVRLLTLERPCIHVTGFDRPNLSFRVLRGENKQQFVVNYASANSSQSGIIYAATRREVDDLYETLLKKGVAAGHYHAGLNDEERKRQQDQFLYDDIRVMVATNAFGMGIDKSNVRYVLHYNMPKNMEAYYQEAGRSGRDGSQGECILLFGAQDVLLQKFLIDKSVEDPRRKQHELAKLQEMVDYCYTPECLRYYILRYFGETVSGGECGSCGNCCDDRERVDITVEAQKVFSCIYRMKERFGITMVAEVLKGSKNKKLRQFGLDNLSTYGLLAEISLEEIKTLIQRLAATGYLFLTESQYPVVKLSPSAYAVMKNQEKVWQKTFVQRQKEADDTLFDRLRMLRRQIAGQESIPPYQVFADATLKELSRECPRDEGAMRRIKGIGEFKLKRYGQAFLQEILRYLAEQSEQSAHGWEEAAGREEVPRIKKSKEPKEQKDPSHLLTLELFRQGFAMAEIAQSRGVTLTTVENHLVRCFEEGHDVDFAPLIPQQEEDMMVDTIRKLGTDRLRTIKEALPEHIGYGAIRAVICKHFAAK
jgi:ATP-dependent DNA helicase RecQ